MDSTQNAREELNKIEEGVSAELRLALRGMMADFIQIEAIKWDIRKATDLAPVILAAQGTIINELIPTDTVELIRAAKAYVLWHHGVIKQPGFVMADARPMGKEFPKKPYPWSLKY